MPVKFASQRRLIKHQAFLKNPNLKRRPEHLRRFRLRYFVLKLPNTLAENSAVQKIISSRHTTDYIAATRFSTNALQVTPEEERQGKHL